MASVFLMKKTNLLSLFIVLLLFLAGCAQAPQVVLEVTAPQDEELPQSDSGLAIELPPLIGNILKQEIIESEQAPTELADSATSTVLPTITSNPNTHALFALMLEPGNCYSSCSESPSGVVSLLSEGTIYTPLGVDSTGTWFQVGGQTSSQSCWVQSAKVDLQFNGFSLKPGDLSSSVLPTTGCPAMPTANPMETASASATPDATETPVPATSPEFDYEAIEKPTRFARLMHDPQWMPWPSRIADPEWLSTNHYDWYPETVPLWLTPKGGNGRLTYSIPWLQYLRAIQPNDAAAVWIARIAAGLFNRWNGFIPILDLDQLEELPRAEGISSGGNVVSVLEAKSGSARIGMLYVGDGSPDFRQINYQNTPWLVTKFSAVSIDGQLGNPGGIDVYFPNLSKQEGGYWVELQRIEMFPSLPFPAVIEQQVVVREKPSISAESIGELNPSKKVVIREYLPQGGDVWGRIDEGWIVLQYQIHGYPVFNTSWEMETRPPINPEAD